MLNLDETIRLKTEYSDQKDLYLKGIAYSTSVISFIECLRSQVPEINLLQLIPGYYLLLLFFSFILLIFLSNLFVTLPLELEIQKSLGTKTRTRLTIFILSKVSFLLFLITLIISLNTIIPISLDSFNSYGEKTLENIWSFEEVINLESILLSILLILSQVPISILSIFNTERDNILLLRLWKPLIFITFIISGFLTPTIDGYTQLTFSTSSFSLYLIILNFLQKRSFIKFKGNSILGF